MSESETKDLGFDDKAHIPATQLKPGTLLNDRYQIQEITGVGGMGTVYRARDTNFQAIRLVAVKEMISQITDPLVRKNIYNIYERESNILATLRHQSIPRIYDYFSLNDRAYLVMEFVNGRNLDDILADTTSFFTEEQVITWAVELCDVLAYLHSYKPEAIVFRDMKPSNIMINNSGHVVLIDFGIAKVFETGQKNTMVGTQGYSPPDQYRGEMSPKVDIYALGATLHHLLTLKDPRLEAPFSFPERPIKDFNPNVTPEFVALIERSLEYNPEDRFESAEEMKMALLAVARKTGALVPEVFSSSSSAPIGAPRGVKPLWTFECEDEIRGSPMFYGGALYVGCYDNNLYSLDAGSGEFRWKYATDGGLPGRPAYYENNIYFGSEDNRLHVVSSRTGSMSWSYYAEAPIRSSPRIAQGHVFFGSDDNYLHAVNSMSGRLSWKFDAGVPIRSTPFITDENVYFGTEGGEFICVDFRGEVKWRFNAKRAITSSPVVHQNVAYFASLDSTLYAVDAKTGWVLWRFRLGKGAISSPVQANNLIVVGSIDHVIYAVDAKSAKEIWRYTTEHQVTGSPIVYKDQVYCGSVDGYLYCLDLKTGAMRWKFYTDGPITGTPVANEDIIYIGSTDKTVYALLAN